MGYSDGYAQAHQTSGTGNAPWTWEWRQINADGSKTIIPDQPMGICGNLAVGNYEYYLRDSSDPIQEFTIPFVIVLHESIGFNVTLTHVTAYGLADGKIIGHITGGVAPYTVDLKVNGNEYRTITGIPAISSGLTLNCDIEGLPSGAYTMWASDSDDPQNKCGGDFTYFVMQPPFVTLNGTVNPLGISTTVSFEYGTGTTYGSVAEFGVMNESAVTPVTAQLSSVELKLATTYHYRVKAVNAYGTSYGDDMTFTTVGALPIVVTLPATNIS
jgi:hypothetical protein